MPFTPPTFDELYATWQREMTKLGFTNWTEGSRIGAMGKVTVQYLLDLWHSLADLEEQVDPSSARGVYLDRIGQSFGVTRLPPQVASTVGRGPSVQFTNNGAATITIPTGTRVWNPSDPDLAFFTARDLVLLAGEQGFVDVSAGSPGANYNIGANVLTAHNAGISQSSVTNVRPIGGGTFFESDDSYRFRISQALQSRNGATETAVRQALLKVPGVRDVLIHSGVRGNGTVDIIVVPIDRFASQALLDAATTAVGDTIAAGISWKVSTPKSVRVDVTVQLRLDGATQLDTIRAQVESAVRSYIDNLRVNDGNGGDTLFYNELVSRIQDADPGILDSATNITIEGVPSLQTDVSPKPGERLVSGSVSVT